MEIQALNVGASLGSISSALPDAVAQIQKDLDDYRERVKAALNAGDLATGLKLLLMELDAHFALQASETVGVAKAFDKDWDALSQEYKDATQTTPLRQATHFSPTNSDGSEVYPGGLTVQSIGSDGNLECTTALGAQVSFNPIDGTGRLKSGVPIFDISSSFVGVTLNSGADPISGNFHAVGGAPGSVIFANRMIQASALKTSDLQQDLLGELKLLRSPGGIVDQLEKKYHIDVSNIQDVLSEFDDAVASSANLSFTFGVATGEYKNLPQSTVQSAQEMKTKLTSAFGVSEAGFNGMATQMQTTLNKEAGLYNSGTQAITSAFSTLFAQLKSIIENIGH